MLNNQKYNHLDDLVKSIRYDKETGRFTSLINRGRVKEGQRIDIIRKDGYARVTFKYRRYLAHRLAFYFMAGRFPKFIDHINHNKGDNRWTNIREVKHCDNMKNLTIDKRNKSGTTGVCRIKSSGRWKAEIRVDGNYKFIGNYIKIEDAIKARKDAEIKYNYHINHGGAKHG